MRYPLFALALVVLVTPACSSDKAGCTYDTDCPGVQVCIDGSCQDWQPADPCQEIRCQAGQICIDGECVAEDTDSDGDGFSVADDCDDTDPAVNPAATERCNQVDDDCDGDTDEENICGDECDQVDTNPLEDPPFDCDASTPCERCARYAERNYYCRSENDGPHGLLALPEDAPCDVEHHCNLLACADRAWHCHGLLGNYLPGDIPTDDPEACNALDDDCDGAIDGPGSEVSCPAREHGTAACAGGTCTYLCEPGYHPCTDACLDDTAVESCGMRCEPCEPPEHASATCEAGQCEFVCDTGHWRVDAACEPCESNDHCGLDCTTCPAGRDCCTDACYDLTVDPNHCGDCEGKCPSEQHVCCGGAGCCAPEHPLCCGPYCCLPDGVCCPGEFCCVQDGTCCTDACCAHPNTVCCGAGCCPSDTTCCNDMYCCPADNPVCCPDGCCPSDYAVCCGDGCCPSDTTCCNDLFCCDTDHPVCCPGGCCPGDFPVCCTEVCCPAGTSCCDGGTACCAK